MLVVYLNLKETLSSWIQLVMTKMSCAHSELANSAAQSTLPLSERMSEQQLLTEDHKAHSPWEKKKKHSVSNKQI